jgi:hypothetical protein
MSEFGPAFGLGLLVPAKSNTVREQWRGHLTARTETKAYNPAAMDLSTLFIAAADGVIVLLAAVVIYAATAGIEWDDISAYLHRRVSSRYNPRRYDIPRTRP